MVFSVIQGISKLFKFKTLFFLNFVQILAFTCQKLHLLKGQIHETKCAAAAAVRMQNTYVYTLVNNFNYFFRKL